MAAASGLMISRRASSCLRQASRNWRKASALPFAPGYRAPVATPRADLMDSGAA